MGFERKEIEIERRPSDEFVPASSLPSTEPEFRRVEVEPLVVKDERNLVNTDINAPENALDASDFQSDVENRFDFPSDQWKQRDLERERVQIVREDLRRQEAPPTDTERRELERLDISETAKDERTFGERVHDLWENTKNTFVAHPTEEREKERVVVVEKEERSSDEGPSLWERAKQTIATTEDKIERAIKPDSEKTFMEKWRDHRDEKEEKERERELERERIVIVKEEGDRIENRVERPIAPEAERTSAEKWSEEKKANGSLTEKIERMFKPERQRDPDFEDKPHPRLDTSDKKVHERW